MSNKPLHILSSILAILVIILFVLASNYANEPSTQHTVKSRVCLEGVNYYLFREDSGNSSYGYLAPVFNKDTKQVELCNE